MTVLRPPITGDVQLDSWMNEVSNTVSSGSGVSVGEVQAAYRDREAMQLML